MTSMSYPGRRPASISQAFQNTFTPMEKLAVTSEDVPYLSVLDAIRFSASPGTEVVPSTRFVPVSGMPAAVLAAASGVVRST